jgi:hypothetical protein
MRDERPMSEAAIEALAQGRHGDLALARGSRDAAASSSCWWDLAGGCTTRSATSATSRCIYHHGSGCSVRSLSASSCASRTTKGRSGVWKALAAGPHPGRHGGASQPAGLPCNHVMHGHGVRAAPQSGTTTPRWRGACSSARIPRVVWSRSRAIRPASEVTKPVAGIQALPPIADRRGL